MVRVTTAFGTWNHVQVVDWNKAFLLLQSKRISFSNLEVIPKKSAKWWKILIWPLNQYGEVDALILSLPLYEYAAITCLLRTSQDALLVFQSSSMKPRLCPRNSYMRHVTMWLSHLGHLTPAKWGTFKTTLLILFLSLEGRLGFVLSFLFSRCHTCT